MSNILVPSGSYYFFCKAAKDIEKEMLRLDAESIHPLGLGDDSAEKGFGEGLHTWLNDIWLALDLQEPKEVPHILPVKLELSKRAVLKDEEDQDAVSQYFNWVGTSNVRISDIKQLSEEGHNRDFISFTLDIGDKLNYELGDALEIFPVNDTARVAEFIHAYSSDFDERTVLNLHAFGISCEVSLGCLFTNVLDIFGKPSMYFLQQLATFEDKESVRRLMLDKKNLSIMTSQKGVTYADLLVEYKSAHPPIAALLSMIPLIKGRAYSITSSPIATPDKIELCVLIDTWWCDEGMKYGLTCDMMRKLHVGDSIQCRIKPGSMEPPRHNQSGKSCCSIVWSFYFICEKLITKLHALL